MPLLPCCVEQTSECADEATVPSRAVMCLPDNIDIKLKKAEHSEMKEKYEEAHQVLIEVSVTNPESSARLQRAEMEIRKGASRDIVGSLFKEAYLEMKDPKAGTDIELKYSQYLLSKGDQGE